jgi:glycerol-3-phosphate acyltransferase PlsY
LFSNSLFAFVLASLSGYVLGSISFSIVFTKIFSNNQDIRAFGSKNAGFTNVFRCFGKAPAALTFVFDALKGIISCLLGEVFFCSFLDKKYCVLGSLAAGFFCVLGHIFPCFFKFKGGKGVLTSAAVVAFIDWHIFIGVVFVFLLTLFISKIVSLSSIFSALSLPLFMFLCLPKQQDQNINYIELFTITLISVLVLFKHKDNIKRIFRGQEKKIFER